MHDAKTHFSKLVRSVEAGEEVVIQRDGTPVAKLVPFEASPRKFGALSGEVRTRDGFEDIPAGFEDYA